MVGMSVVEGASQAKGAIPDSVVKSAGRTLQILEFFDEVQREACVTEISRALHYPQSSTSVLLRSLVSMGYLQHDRYKRTYFPTRRVSLLGSWVDQSLMQRGELLDAAESLHRASQQTVVMATANGLYAQYIYVQRARRDAESNDPASIGRMLPVARTAVGKALLSTYDETYIAKLVRRLNAERNESEEPINHIEFYSELKTGRRRGWFRGGASSDGHIGLAAVLDNERQLLVIGIEGPQEEIVDQIDVLASLLRQTATQQSSRRMLMSA